MDLSRASQWFPRSFADRHSGAASLRLDARTSGLQGPFPPPQPPQLLSIRPPRRRDRDDPPYPLLAAHTSAGGSIAHAGAGLILNCASTGVGAAWGALWQANTASASLSNNHHVTAGIPAPRIGVKGVLYG